MKNSKLKFFLQTFIVYKKKFGDTSFTTICGPKLDFSPRFGTLWHILTYLLTYNSTSTKKYSKSRRLLLLPAQKITSDEIQK